MVYELIQDSSGLSAAFSLQHNGWKIAEAKMPDNLTFNFAWTLSFNTPGNPRYRFEKYEGEPENAAGQRLILPVSVVANNGEPVGRVAQLRSEGGLLGAYDYYETCFYTSTYEAFPVGLGEDGMKFPIHREGYQEALIEKDIMVRDNLDRYKISALDERACLAGTLTALYIDAAVFARRGEKVSSSRDISYMRTINRDLLEKYDPLFTVRC